jgi:hypothetical protein
MIVLAKTLAYQQGGRDHLAAPADFHGEIDTFAVKIDWCAMP